MPAVWWKIEKLALSKAKQRGHELGPFLCRSWRIGFGCGLRRAKCKRCGAVCHIHCNWFGAHYGRIMNLPDTEFLIEGSAVDTDCGNSAA